MKTISTYTVSFAVKNEKLASTRRSREENTATIMGSSS